LTNICKGYIHRYMEHKMIIFWEPIWWLWRWVCLIFDQATEFWLIFSWLCWCDIFDQLALMSCNRIFTFYILSLRVGKLEKRIVRLISVKRCPS
jgi:hypothetical protein